jgi:hypothetical protein
MPPRRSTPATNPRGPPLKVASSNPPTKTPKASRPTPHAAQPLHRASAASFLRRHHNHSSTEAIHPLPLYGHFRHRTPFPPGGVNSTTPCWDSMSPRPLGQKESQGQRIQDGREWCRADGAGAPPPALPKAPLSPSQLPSLGRRDRWQLSLPLAHRGEVKEPWCRRAQRDFI